MAKLSVWVRVARAAALNSCLNWMLDEAQEILRGQLDPMVASLKDTDPTAVQLWDTARHIHKPSTTHTQLLATVALQDGGELLPVPNASILAVNGKNHVRVSNELGEVLFKPLPFGSYDLRCELPGFQHFLLKDYKVVRGRVNKVEVMLQKEA